MFFPGYLFSRVFFNYFCEEITTKYFQECMYLNLVGLLLRALMMLEM